MLTEGEARRDTGCARAEDAADPDYRDRCRETIRQLARWGLPFTADTVVQAVGLPASGTHNIIGACIRGAAKLGLIRCVDFTMSRRPGRHAGMVRVWRGA